MHGADSEHSFRKLLDEHLPATTSPAIATAIMAYKQNDHDIAFTLLIDAMKSEPENMAIPLTLIKLYLRKNKHEEINKLYETLPESVKKNSLS